MSANTWIRQFHRWMSVAFAAAFVFTSVALATKAPLAWAPYVPLAPLFALAITGVYLFLLPYFGRSVKAA
jgi:hypothetical protein